MLDSEYDLAVFELDCRAKDIRDAKRPAYTIGSKDVLNNFKTVADRVGIDPRQVWLVYFLKHVDAITSAAKDPNIPQAEALLDRFADAINYLHLGWAIVSEESKTQTFRRGNIYDSPLPPF